MTEPLHPAASGQLPWFITAPGTTDVLLVVASTILALFVFMVGIIYFQLHALPDRLAHKKIQLEIVCVLGLIAMFTHLHIFWVAGLLIAFVDFPDFSQLNRISASLNRIAGSAEKRVLESQRAAGAARDDTFERSGGVTRSDGPAAAPRKRIE